MCYNKLMVKKSRRGFTLLELSLSLAFISVLSIIIALITSDMTTTYQRGLTLKQINTVGSDLIDDIRSAIAGSSAKGITTICYSTYTGGDSNNTEAKKCADDGASRFVSLTRTANVDIRGKAPVSTPVFGVFCSGTYSYIWNSGYFFNDSTTVSTTLATFKYKDVNGAKVTYPNDIHLLKVLDPSRAVCVAEVGANYNGTGAISSNIDLTGDGFPLVTETPTDLLITTSDKNTNLAIYDFSVFRPAQDALTKNALYSGSFILASIRGGIDIRATGNYCATPDDYAVEDFDYCAINKFNFAIRATGE